MKKRIGLVKFMIVCLALFCLCMADDFVGGKAGGDVPVPERVASSSSLGCTDFSFTASAVQCSVPRTASSVNSLRTSFQTQRQNTTGSSRTGFTIIKAGKSMNEYSTSLFRRSIASFPSGMNESNNRLIVLGKLII